MSLLLPALAVLALSGQASGVDAGQTPEAPTAEAREEAAEPRTERVCRYVKTTGSTMQQRVCSNEPRQRARGNVHSMMEAREMLRRRQGSRVPDAG